MRRSAVPMAHAHLSFIVTAVTARTHYCHHQTIPVHNLRQAGPAYSSASIVFPLPKWRHTLLERPFRHAINKNLSLVSVRFVTISGKCHNVTFQKNLSIWHHMWRSGHGAVATDVSPMQELKGHLMVHTVFFGMKNSSSVKNCPGWATQVFFGPGALVTMNNNNRAQQLHTATERTFESAKTVKLFHQLPVHPEWIKALSQLAVHHQKFAAEWNSTSSVEYRYPRQILHSRANGESKSIVKLMGKVRNFLPP